MISGDKSDQTSFGAQARLRRAFGPAVMGLLWSASFAITGASAQADLPQRFDLVCSGTVTSWADSDSTSTDWTTTARVDLTDNRFCLDDCLDSRHVSAGRSDTIESLSLGRESRSPERSEFVDKIDLDRRSGRYYRVHDWVETPGGYQSEAFPIMHHDIYSGRCALAEFTGFPRRQF